MKVHGFVNKPIFHFEEAPQPRTKISYKLYEKLFACTSTNAKRRYHLGTSTVQRNRFDLLHDFMDKFWVIK